MSARRSDSRWLLQTKVGGFHAALEDRGDCVPACIASILGVPIDAVENCHGEGWWDRLQATVGSHGFCLAVIDVNLEPPPTYWIASLPSLNLAAKPMPWWVANLLDRPRETQQPLHSVVAHGYELVHDPSLGKRYDEQSWAAAWNAGQIKEGWVLVEREERAA
jgi:hypothetical protein